MAKSNKSAKANPAAKRVEFLKLASPKRATVKREELTFDRRLQHRTKLVDEPTVEEYAAIVKDCQEQKRPVPFPPLKAIRQKEADGVIWWVYDGFQRGAAYELSGVDEVEVEYIDGTYSDAFFLSLSSNSDHGKNRTGDDKRRAVYALIDDEEAFALVQSKAKGNGGLHRVMSAAIGVSTGWIVSALAERGLSVKGDKLVKAKPKKEPKLKDSAEATPQAGEVEPAGTVGPAQPLDAAAVKARNDAAFAQQCATDYEERVAEGMKLSRRLGVIIATLVTDRERAGEVRGIMAQHGIGISDDFDVKAREEGDAFQPYYQILESWPVAAKLGMFFADLKRVAERPAEAAPAEAAPAEAAPAELAAEPAPEPAPAEATPAGEGEPAEPTRKGRKKSK